MSLLEVLGLPSRAAAKPAGAPKTRAAESEPAPAGGGSSSSGADGVVAAHDRIAAIIVAIADDKARNGLDAELAALRATHAKVGSVTDPTQRATLDKAEAAAAARLETKARGVATQDRQKHELSDARAELAAVLSQISAIVLGGFSDDAARKRINDELGKLKAAEARAGKIADPKSAVTALAAVRVQAEDLRARADRTKDALDWAEAHIAPALAAAQTAVVALAPTARAVLQRELDAVKADSRRAADAGDRASLQSAVSPRLKKIGDVATGLDKASTQIDAFLATAAQGIVALDAAARADLAARLKTLQDEKKAAWPTGGSLDEMAASIEKSTAAARTLLADIDAKAKSLIVDQGMAELQKQFDALKPRIDQATELAVPVYIAKRQDNVQRLATTMTAQLDGRVAGAAKTLASLRLVLGDTEKFKALRAAHLARLEAAKNGGIKAALALKLAPPGLAAARDNAMAQREMEIEALTVDGVFGQADAEIGKWLVEAKAWSSARKAYDSLHSKDPDAGVLEDLAGVPGGGAALDALVADLPIDKTPPQVFIKAMKARYGVDVEQFEHRKDGGKSEDPDKSTKLDPSKPDSDQEKDLQGLYKVLGQVPAADVKHVEKINRFTKDVESASYSSGVFTDVIALHCGRPGDAGKTPFNTDGVVVPLGEKVQAGCEPVKKDDTAPFFDFTVLHEVGHAVDDARSIMNGGRDKDAGWDTHGTGAVAKKIAAHLHFDADYLEDMLDDANSALPKNKPKPPAGVKQKDWDDARSKAEAWVQAIRVGKKLWDDAGGAKAHRIDGRVYHEAYDGSWVSYRYDARSQGVTGYQFRAPGEWFAELYATFHTGKLNPKHPAAPWLQKLKSESKAAS